MEQPDCIGRLASAWNEGGVNGGQGKRHKHAAAAAHLRTPPGFYNETLEDLEVTPWTEARRCSRLTTTRPPSSACVRDNVPLNTALSGDILLHAAGITRRRKPAITGVPMTDLRGRDAVYTQRQSMPANPIITGLQSPQQRAQLATARSSQMLSHQARRVRHRAAGEPGCDRGHMLGGRRESADRDRHADQRRGSVRSLARAMSPPR